MASLTREQTTKRIFATVEVVLCLVMVATFASLSLSGGGLSQEALSESFAQNPASALVLLAGCAQAFIAYVLRILHRRYEVGDTGQVVANLIALLCAEMLLKSMVGVVAMAVLLWRTWRRGAEDLADWRSSRGVGGVLVDLSASIAVLVLAVICFAAGLRLGA